MLITNITQVSFDPVKEYKEMMTFVLNHDMKQWQKNESTAAVTYTLVARHATTYKEDEE